MSQSQMESGWAVHLSPQWMLAGFALVALIAWVDVALSRRRRGRWVRDRDAREAREHRYGGRR